MTNERAHHCLWPRRVCPPSPDRCLVVRRRGLPSYFPPSSAACLDIGFRTIERFRPPPVPFNDVNVSPDVKPMPAQNLAPRVEIAPADSIVFVPPIASVTPVLCLTVGFAVASKRIANTPFCRPRLFYTPPPGPNLL